MTPGSVSGACSYCDNNEMRMKTKMVCSMGRASKLCQLRGVQGSLSFLDCSGRDSCLKGSLVFGSWKLGFHTLPFWTSSAMSGTTIAFTRSLLCSALLFKLAGFVVVTPQVMPQPW